jgi:hypothetical protein
MNNVNNWKAKAEEALNSLDGIQRAASNPFLYSRIRERLADHQNKWARIANFIGRPVIAFSVTALFVGVNAWAVIEHPFDKKIAKPVQQAREQAFDQDYATVDYSFVDVNNAEK